MLFFNYLYWHYVIAPVEIVKLLKNYSIATSRKFLIFGHLKTLFYPWHRLRVSDVAKPKNITDRVANVAVEAYIRLVAAIIRMTVVLFGVTVQITILFLFIVIFLAWLMWPALVFISLAKGITIIF
ncbi:MAG: hypothetical protein A3B96_01760 [Candidatus Spechtbacteria bacterium RIFCSPHIGHO2_02_FULL_43_15b]|uniref:Uncharacterized protein n=1 Tax=Candidatus Spechtbacteria bacterium RIFCSPHIGHO2_01_FULL_43_30 TaxID=1802158 RepID=A0A1G2H752_9BACT|nr:MAG: hypothetical protein A2827_01005 [Candidatus Spechtbacteria bacterium RIFCSPHIGHO2_01_FULL_43_30]OGZ60115.1 MAG: hypothetical protein A3B96_01760 [Candidatus Spechtbacteria bacterium RIFCSPHIGHO2_02_FULL_43_15b]